MRYWFTICYLLFFLLGVHTCVVAQDSIYRNKKGSSKVRRAADDLKKVLETNDEEKTAKQYETLANELTDKGDYAKAEEYLKKAKEIYLKLNKQPEVATISRSLAKVQELQEKIKPAIQNYESAAEKSKDSNLEKANLNDANRLRTTDPQVQQTYAQDNANIFEKEGKKSEASNAYRQVAETQVLLDNSKDALSNFKKAIEINSSPKEVVTLSNKMAKAYAANNQLDKAITLSKSLLDDAKKQNDSEQQIDQLIALSGLYQQYGNTSQAGLLLKEAYELAAKTGNTTKAKATILSLAALYEGQNNNQKAIETYQVFLTNLDSIIKKDSSLIDARLFEVTEGRIKELEKEKILQQELMSRQTRFNYFLIVSIVLMLLLLFFIMRVLFAIRIKNKKIALQSLRREMNPHFIFNSLNSVNQYIAENNEREANKYLTSYSSLMRNVMEHSGKDLVTLNTEVDQLKKYLELEHQRFRTKFDYSITIADSIDTELTLVPNMLIQPHLENAIWHGLRYKDGKGHLQMDFEKKEKTIKAIITDDGIGISKSKLLKTDNQKLHQSRGISNTMERISLLNDIYKTSITINIEEITGENRSGTRVIINFPIIMKK